MTDELFIYFHYRPSPLLAFLFYSFRHTLRVCSSDEPKTAIMKTMVAVGSVFPSE